MPRSTDPLVRLKLRMRARRRTHLRFADHLSSADAAASTMRSKVYGTWGSLGLDDLPTTAAETAAGWGEVIASDGWGEVASDRVDGAWGKWTPETWAEWTGNAVSSQ
ncbi:hypothetical protein B0H16DRAFT_1744474 [Mycena metata]|uniref:Uncharacterized protein n=1 Tax=Mycena metata TaxID=1033252 RepID=A0AAD7MDR5_9AGAR|nr:hypothetical protein B0H16DRAFT_1744474 [Mycena metata]